MKPRLLIVDDDQVYAGDLALVLEEEYRCAVCTNLEEAEERIRAERPSVVLLDLHFGPDHDSFGLLETIRTLDDTLPVVMMSDQPSISSVVNAVRRGVFGFLPKSADLRELKEVLVKAVHWQKEN